jgi:RNA polymerase sigma-70 factor (ECF subfamily)
MTSFAAARFRTLPLASPPELNSTQVVIRNVVGKGDSEELIARIGTSDREALSDLFLRFAAGIRNVGRRILRDDAEADDLVQEVFLYIYRKSALFDRSKSSARSWIFQVAYTQAFLRRRQLKARGFYASGIADRPPETDPRTTSGAEYDQTVEGLFGRNGWRKIQDALTEEQRETLRLHFFEGYTFAEIAEKLGQSYANVRNHHYRGLEKLRKHLAEETLNRR